ncbi:MAG: ParB/RepB/Spo0J family partition protein, partial [Actinobacteria bacterium]|nr:ParB/RepB/Spo0J family partition protein [Actinomycetota bacterium]
MVAMKPNGRSGGLGRGLGSLLANTSTEVPSQKTEGSADQASTSEATAVSGARYAELPIDAIRPNPRQPRAVFDQEALDELVHSIKEIGLLQPVVVRALGSDKFELVAGERRLRSSKIVGLTHIPAIIRETADADMLRDALL